MYERFSHANRLEQWLLEGGEEVDSWERLVGGYHVVAARRNKFYLII